MEPSLLGLQSQLEEIKRTLRELKAENAVLRNEILGTGNSASTTAECVGILEKKSLREFVGEMQFDIKSIKTSMEDGNRASQRVEEQPLAISDSMERLRSNDFKKTANIPAEFLREFPVVEIKQKTIEEERAWIKLKFNEERAKRADPADGASLVGRSVESIFSSVTQNPTCVLKLSNHLNSALVDPQEFFERGAYRISGPTNAILGRTSEAFSYKGNGIHTQFLLSFQVTNELRLAVALFSWRHERTMDVTLGFVPEGIIPTGLSLIDYMETNARDPVAHVLRGSVEGAGVDYFINHGNFLARARVCQGPGKWMVHLDILEFVPASIPRCVPIPYAPNDLAGLVEISNCLNVSLKKPESLTRTDGLQEIGPAEILPLTREAFVSLDKTYLEGMFSYEIASTDLSLSIAFRFQGTNSAFSAAFVPLPTFTLREDTIYLAMEPKQWKSHFYRKYARAKDGEQEIQIRNIRARVSMTNGEKPQLKILIFTV